MLMENAGTGRVTIGQNKRVTVHKNGFHGSWSFLNFCIETENARINLYQTFPVGSLVLFSVAFSLLSHTYTHTNTVEYHFRCCIWLVVMVSSQPPNDPMDLSHPTPPRLPIQLFYRKFIFNIALVERMSLNLSHE